MKIIFTLLLLTFGLLVNAQEKTDSYYYEKANKEIERVGGYNNIVLENIEKAIELNPDNVDYRWIRARCLMNKRTQEIAVIRAIEDINFMLSKGESSAKVYNLLALAYSELGEKYRLKKAKKSGGFSDDDTDYVKTQTGYYNEAITNYEKAINAYNKMIEIKPDTSESVVYKVRELEEEIKDINELRSKLK